MVGILDKNTAPDWRLMDMQRGAAKLGLSGILPRRRKGPLQGGETVEQDRFTAAVRKVLGRYLSAHKIEALRLELIRAGLIARDEGQAPYEVGPPISPLHS